MPEIKEGSFELSLGLVKLGAKLSEDDRQCARELYTEIVTRVAIVGKRLDPTCEDFAGIRPTKSRINFVNSRNSARIGGCSADHAKS